MMANRSARMRRKTEEVKDDSTSERSAEIKVSVSYASSSRLGAVWWWLGMQSQTTRWVYNLDRRVSQHLL